MDMQINQSKFEIGADLSQGAIFKYCRWTNNALAGSYVVIGVDVSIDRPRRSVAKRQKEDVNVEHPVEIGEHLRPVLQGRTMRRWVKEGCELTEPLETKLP